MTKADAGVVLMAYGSPERLADVPAYYADIRGGRPIRPELLDDLVERYRRLGIDRSSPLNAVTEETRAALEARARPAGLHRHEALDAAHRGGGRARARVRRGHDRRARARAALLAALDRGLPRRSSRRRSPAARSSRFVESWHDEPGFVDAARRPRPRHRRARRLHRALPAGADPRRGRPVPGPAARDARASSPQQRGAERLVVLVPERVARPASRGSGPDILDHLAALQERGSSACSSARSASSPTTSRSSGTSTTRPWSARRSSGSTSRGSRCRTPTRRSCACSRAWCGRRFRYRRSA